MKTITTLIITLLLASAASAEWTDVTTTDPITDVTTYQIAAREGAGLNHGGNGNQLVVTFACYPEHGLTFMAHGGGLLSLEDVQYAIRVDQGTVRTEFRENKRYGKTNFVYLTGADAEALAAELINGSTLTVRFWTVDRDPITIQTSLEGFGQTFRTVLPRGCDQ